MSKFYAHFTQNIVGYIALFLFCVLILATNIFYLFIPMLFMYLITDVIVSFTRQKISFIPDKMIILILYAALIGLFIFILIKYVPIFLSDISLYTKHIKEAIETIIMNFSKKFHLNIDLSFVREQAVAHASNSFGRIFKIFNNITKGIIWFIFTLFLNFLLYTEGKKIKYVFTSNKNSLLTYI